MWRTLTVIASLPLLGLDEATVTAGGWMVQQALAQGVHGVHLARARDPEGVKRFVQATRYPIHEQATDTLGVGLRGWGSHTFAAWVWGLSVPEYLHQATGVKHFVVQPSHFGEGTSWLEPETRHSVSWRRSSRAVRTA